MPLLRNAIKKMRQDKKRTEANKAKRSQVRTILKNARTLKTAEALQTAFSSLDKAAKKHLLHKKKANRLKSRLAKAIAKVAENAGVTKAKTTTKKTSTKKATTKRTTKATA